MKSIFIQCIYKVGSKDKHAMKMLAVKKMRRINMSLGIQKTLTVVCLKRCSWHSHSFLLEKKKTGCEDVSMKVLLVHGGSLNVT